MSASDAARSRGDVMARLAELTDRVTRLETTRRLEAAAVGRGGIRIKGGRLLAEDLDNDTVFEVTTQPAGIFMRKELISALVNDLVEELLTSQAGRDLAAFVLSSRIKSATTEPSVLTSSSTYVALSGGPEVTDVPVSESGKMLVMVGCQGVVSSAIGQPDQAAAMSFAISGATTRAASDDEAYIVAYVDIDELSFFHGRSMAAAEITGLNPGMHTVSARYRKVFGGGDVDFSLRTLIAIGL